MKYVVMSREQYTHLRECELEAALAESKADLDAGRFVKETAPSISKPEKRLESQLAVSREDFVPQENWKLPDVI